MPVPVQVHLPEELVGEHSPAELAEEIRVLLVLDRYRRREITERQAVLFLGLTRIAFLDLAAAHGISTLGYDAAELREEGEG